MTAGEWEPSAADWVRWARTPGHDAYWWFRDAFFDDLLPPPGRRTLEVGCGEGRVTRDLVDRGHRVTGVDTALGLVREARLAPGGGTWALADGAGLPFPDGCFDLVVAYNSLQVVADMPAAVREAARVLDPGGRLAFCVSHPVTDLGRFLGDEPDAPFALRSRYFESERVDDTVEMGGLIMRFRGRTWSLEHYARALEGAGLRIEALREPRPAGGGERFGRRRRVPMFLSVLAGR
ncbi:MAG TPA: class I SAM-dependent methyltransferase [Acidimicrobiales bacterium]|nr:class I SAM-dependent methyltransferase [Acidimicrobiales bacterium]